MTFVDDPSSERLWESQIPRCGVVRAVIIAGDHAARLDDLNGDGREVVLTGYVRGEGGWQLVVDQDDVGLPGPEDSPVTGWTEGSSWAVGRDRPGARLEVSWYDERTIVEADADGWWLAVLPAEPPHLEEPVDPFDFPQERGPRVRPTDR